MTQSIRLSLFVSSILTGFYGGIGFFGFMSFLATLERLPVDILVPFWRLIDGYMGARMPIFGPIMLLSLLVTLFMLRRQWRSLSFWLVVAAFGVLLIDVVVAVTQNIPVNQAIQDRSAIYTPVQLEAFRTTMVQAFYMRSTLMIVCFVLVNLAWLFSRLPYVYQRLKSQ